MKTEVTSKRIASLSAGILNGSRLAAAESWLARLAAGQATTTQEDQEHAVTLIGVLGTVRSIAGSALTQRG